MHAMQVALESMDAQSRIDDFEWSLYESAVENHSRVIRDISEAFHTQNDLVRTQNAVAAMEGLTIADRGFMVTLGLLESQVAVECLDNDTRRAVALESITDLAKTVMEQIKRFFNWLMEAAGKLYARLREGLGRIEKESRKLKAPGPGDYPLNTGVSPTAMRFLTIGGAVHLDKLPASDNTMLRALELASNYDQQLIAAITGESFDRSPEDIADSLLDSYFTAVSNTLVGDICGDVRLERTKTGVELVYKDKSPSAGEVTCTNANDWNNLANTESISKRIADSRKEAEKNNKKLKGLLDIAAKATPELASKQFTLISRVVTFRENVVSAISNNMVSVLRYRLELAKSLTSASNGSKKP